MRKFSYGMVDHWIFYFSLLRFRISVDSSNRTWLCNYGFMYVRRNSLVCLYFPSLLGTIGWSVETES